MKVDYCNSTPQQHFGALYSKLGIKAGSEADRFAADALKVDKKFVGMLKGYLEKAGVKETELPVGESA